MICGASMAMMVRSGLGVMPWDVLHQGLASRAHLSFGTVVIATSLVVLLLWVRLRQWPGLGTVLNAVLVGLAADLTLAFLDPPDGLALRVVLLGCGLVLNAFGSAAYIGAQLGPGPRDGLMTGVARRTGWSLRRVRTGIEGVVLVLGALLGGVVGIGTLLYALGVGPLLQLFLPFVTAPVHEPVTDES
jgi:uncharacterized membrane protein YczE